MPYLLNWTFALSTGWLADYLIASGKVSRATVRKSLSAIGHLVPALALVVLSFIGCNVDAAIALLCIGLMFNGAIYAGFNVNTIELSPNYAGTMRGFVSIGANTMGFLAPAVASYIIDGEVNKFKHIVAQLRANFCLLFF